MHRRRLLDFGDITYIVNWLAQCIHNANPNTKSDHDSTSEVCNAAENNRK